MIILKAINDTEAGFDCELHIEGEKWLIVNQLTTLFNSVYAKEPNIFEAALVDCQYTIDHT